MSVTILVLGIVVIYLGLNGYGKFFDEKIIKTNSNRATPATMYADGVDFIPTSRNVLFGFQFKSIAGAAPVLGPIIALKWGWLPGLLWILGGSFFIGWIHDYTSSMISVRNDGKTFGGISHELISPRARKILLTFIYFYLLLVATAFGNIIAETLTKPAMPLPTIALTLAGIVTGLMIYRGKGGLGLATITGIIILIVGIALGNTFPIPGSKIVWLLFTLGFCYLGSVLPIWSFTQPINYMGFYIIFIGIIGAVLGIIVGRPEFTMPMFRVVEGEPIWPLLFVTIACGAISGWHSLVSSTGTARQLENEKDARPVVGGAMFLEAFLALISLIAGATIIGGLEKYKELDGMGSGAGKIFFSGLADLYSRIGVPQNWGLIFGGVFLIVLTITIEQLVIRFMRVASNELLAKNFQIIRNPHIGSFLALTLTFVLIYTGTFKYIWILFGAANQLMASLALMICTVWLVKEGKSAYYTGIPTVFMYVMTMSALFITGSNIFKKIACGGLPTQVLIGNIVALTISVILFIAAILLILDGYKALKKHATRTS